MLNAGVFKVLCWHGLLICSFNAVTGDHWSDATYTFNHL